MRQLPESAAEPLRRMLFALAEEFDPPTTVREPADAVEQHVADSLSGFDIEALQSAKRIVDIGAGAGFPGLVIATVRSDAAVDLIESGDRKCEVIERLAAAAGLRNIRTIPERAEDWARGEGAGFYDVATARALAPLAVILEYAAPLLREGGSLVAYKGRREPDEESGGEKAAEQLGMKLADVIQTQPFARVRGRHIYHYVKAQPTPKKFPRRNGRAVKRPLG